MSEPRKPKTPLTKAARRIVRMAASRIDKPNGNTMHYTYERGHLLYLCDAAVRIRDDLDDVAGRALLLYIAAAVVERGIAGKDETDAVLVQYGVAA